ncbi:MAG: hypothetical protein IK068_06970, partial [Lachnospiraceae bacterium]|nr:hypothetical protein [Lachnospiraceae bacterium]
LNELLSAPYENCFTPVVVGEFPLVKELLNKLSAYGKSFMSGSGSSCFAEFDDEDSAIKAQQEFIKEGYRCFVAKSVKKATVLTELDKL